MLNPFRSFYPMELTTVDPTSPELQPQVMIRELDHRKSNGIEVTLLWNVRTKGVFVSVLDEREGEGFQFSVAPGDALEAFRHPYAYADLRRDVATAA